MPIGERPRISAVSRIPTILRILLGLGFTVFGLNYFLNFLPAQPPPPAEAGAFLGGLVSSKLLTLVKLIEVGGGLLLLSGFFVPLALALLAPILVGMVFFHAMLAPSGIGPAAALMLIEIALAWFYRDAFAPMLRAKVSPTTA
jgi:putative oxidoreductase